MSVLDVFNIPSPLSGVVLLCTIACYNRDMEKGGWVSDSRATRTIEWRQWGASNARLAQRRLLLSGLLFYCLLPARTLDYKSVKQQHRMVITVERGGLSLSVLYG